MKREWENKKLDSYKINSLTNVNFKEIRIFNLFETMDLQDFFLFLNGIFKYQFSSRTLMIALGNTLCFSFHIQSKLFIPGKNKIQQSITESH